MLGNTFYFGSIRKVTGAFGAVFKDVRIARFDSTGAITRHIDVPISYAPGARWMRANRQRQEGDARVRMSLPRMSFEISSVTYDAARQKSPHQYQRQTIDGDVTRYLQQMNGVPYDITFSLYIKTKTEDDLFQITEQVLPYFAPSYNLKVKEIPEMGIVRDVPLIFEGIDIQEDFEGSFETGSRSVEATLRFVAKTQLYPPISDYEIIRKIVQKVYPNSNIEGEHNLITTVPNPVDAAESDPWTEDTTVDYKEE